MLDIKKKNISIVSPVYGCAASLEKLVEGIKKSMASIGCKDFEIILVNDKSPDNSWDEINRLSKTHPEIIGLNLSRNFGQHASIQAGLEKSSGEWVVVMDCDLQDRPDQIPKLYSKAQEGWDLVVAKRIQRQDSLFKRLGSKSFYSILSYLTETEIDPSVANFGIYHKKVVKALLAMGDYVRFFPTMSAWVGFKRADVEVEHAPRESGKSSYSFSKLVRLGFNVILSFSDKPLRIVVKIGFIIMMIVGLAALIITYRYITGDIEVIGYTSLLLSIWFFGGLTISILGLTGLYVGKAFDQSKNRPIYLVQETTGENHGHQ